MALVCAYQGGDLFLVQVRAGHQSHLSISPSARCRLRLSTRLLPARARSATLDLVQPRSLAYQYASQYRPADFVHAVRGECRHRDTAASRLAPSEPAVAREPDRRLPALPLRQLASHLPRAAPRSAARWKSGPAGRRGGGAWTRRGRAHLAPLRRATARSRRASCCAVRSRLARLLCSAAGALSVPFLAARPATACVPGDLTPQPLRGFARFNRLPSLQHQASAEPTAKPTRDAAR